MAKRLRVLISAYACEPNKGSEPEVGWKWAMHMAQFHDVTVLTRSNNRAPIEKALSILPPDQRVPKFVYHDMGRFVLFLKKAFGITQIYYILWQKSAHKVIADLHKRECYDLMHHLTFAAYRYIAAI